MEVKEFIETTTDEIKSFKKSQEDKQASNDLVLKKMGRDLDEIIKKANRPFAPDNQVDSALSKDLNAFIRSRGEKKGMSLGSDPSGGYASVPHRESGIGDLLRDKSPLRSLVNVTEVGSNESFEEIVSQGGSDGSWVGELEARSETDAATLIKVTTDLHESYAMPTVSQRLLDDSYVDVGQWLNGQIATKFAELEGAALFDGTGVNQPLGLTQHTINSTADATRDFGDLQYTASGDASLLDDADALISLFYSLKSSYRSASIWVMNSNTARVIMQLKEATTNAYIWSHGDIANDRPATLLGRPVVIDENAPSIGANAFPVWVGDWNEAIRFIQRNGIKLLADAYTSKPNVRFYAYQRVGFQVRDSNAIKCLKIAAS